MIRFRLAAVSALAAAVVGCTAQPPSEEPAYVLPEGYDAPGTAAALPDPAVAVSPVERLYGPFLGDVQDATGEPHGGFDSDRMAVFGGYVACYGLDAGMTVDAVVDQFGQRSEVFGDDDHAGQFVRVAVSDLCGGLAD